MTWEEAIVELKAYMESDCYLDAPSNETCSIAINALRPITREQVEKALRGEWEMVAESAWGKQYECSKCHTRTSAYSHFCPECGHPLTNEAVQMVMERLEELKNGNDD